MSNTARKARKRAGIQFSKPAKVATPFYDREAFKQRTARKQERIAEAHMRVLTPAIKEVLAILRPPKPARPVRNYSR
ncbi:hypothetical protein [Leifsonia sp. TF02-11]|uniref:hypothetical protein n=1 Tax=Leifsonia sp. TF02-11 TaxID=2815212 RepID=UPI001AA111BC|nr:hypothetical protein [Leifsonia sp. TF02-11]MBO1739708.1 hypothetical protein [Leifsonia sp. TF02-11]